jgi:phage terminase large subunit-like protein
LARRKSELVKEVRKLKAENQVTTDLPHLFLLRPYKWQIEYWQDPNRMKFICAANQCGKSYTQIIHAIDLATDETKWAKFFPKRPPQVMWYVYPNKSKIQEEFREKWEKELLPRGAMQNHIKYGWQKFNIDGEFGGIKFNSGVSIYFKSWGQDLQASTVDTIFVDEEIPKELYPELDARLTATSGIFSMVFTATLNQAFWYDVIERRGKRGERFTHASKWQISMEYDCKYFADGTPSHFTEEFINKRKNSIGDPIEIERRVHGRFVTSEGIKFKSFQKSRNLKQPMQIPKDWELFSGVDIGTGGTGHPPAIAIVAVRPDYKYGRMIRFWKGNDGSDYTSSQVLNKYIEMTRELNISGAYYDWHSKEFYLRASNIGLSFTKAEKTHSVGDDLLNILFKNNMLDLEECEQVEDLIHELETLKSTTAKTKAVDDGIDGLRYAISSLPWDMSDITSQLIEIKDEEEERHDERMTHAMKMSDKRPPQDDDFNTQQEIDEYNELNNIGGDYYDDEY